MSRSIQALRNGHGEVIGYAIRNDVNDLLYTRVFWIEERAIETSLSGNSNDFERVCMCATPDFHTAVIVENGLERWGTQRCIMCSAIVGQTSFTGTYPDWNEKWISKRGSINETV